MCRPASLNYKVQAPIAGAMGLMQAPDLKTSNGSSSNRKHHPHIVVQHHYHDHANESESIEDRPARGGVTTPFPIRLHKMLDQMEADGHSDVIGWQQHGRCFVVRKPKEFKELLPRYFKLSKMSSFQRQLNLYGFQRLTRGRDKNGYYHEYFLRGKAALSHKIQRTKVKGTGVRARSNPTTEPHLWEMPWVGTECASANHYHNNSDSASLDSTPETTPTVAPKPMPVAAFQMQQQPQVFMPPLTSSVAPMFHPNQFFPQEEQSEQDMVMSFGGKMFHYLDPQEMMQEAVMRKKQQDACQKNDMHSFMTNLELDNLYSQIDDETVDNDDAFMDMLERVIE